MKELNTDTAETTEGPSPKTASRLSWNGHMLKFAQGGDEYQARRRRQQQQDNSVSTLAKRDPQWLTDREGRRPAAISVPVDPAPERAPHFVPDFETLAEFAAELRPYQAAQRSTAADRTQASHAAESARTASASADAKLNEAEELQRRKREEAKVAGAESAAAADAYTAGRGDYAALEAATTKRDVADRGARAAQAFVEAASLAAQAARGALEEHEAKLKAAESVALAAEVLVLRAKAATAAAPILDKIAELRGPVAAYTEALERLRALDRYTAEEITPKRSTLTGLILVALHERFTGEGE
jgi:hypothetical protein